jgi:hypothetical protein
VGKLSIKTLHQSLRVKKLFKKNKSYQTSEKGYFLGSLYCFYLKIILYILAA